MPEDNTTMITEVNEENSIKSTKKAPAKVLVMGAVVAIILGLTGLGGLTAYGVYRGSENPVIVALASAFRVPVAKVNGATILYRDYVRDLNSLRTFYTKKQTGVSYTKDEESDQVLSRLIANIMIEQVAQELNVTVNETDRETAKKDLLARFDNDETKLATDLKDSLGITLPEFFDRILEPTILEKKAAEQFATNADPKYSAFSEDQVRARHILFPVTTPTDDAKAKADASRVLKEIQKGGDFAELAQKYGTDGTKDQGGDLGWFGRGDMVKEFEDAAFGLNKGELAKTPVKTQFGYHIIKTDDKRTAKNFSAYMNEKLKSAKIEVFGKIHNPFANLQGGATVTTQ